MQTRLIRKSAIGLSVALLAAASLLTPALAAKKSTKHWRHHDDRVAHYRSDWYGSHDGRGRWMQRYPNGRSPNWALRNMDPYGNRCVEDLGYGRYVYCGW